MRILALDLSTKTGWALLEGEMGQVPKIIETGTINNDGMPVSSFGEYPWGLELATKAIGKKVYDLIDQKSGAGFDEVRLNALVVEETNKPGKFGNRYSQKCLEWIHAYVVTCMATRNAVLRPAIPMYYINTSDWRKTVGARLTDADKKLNIKVRQLKKKNDKAALKALGVRGKINKKHVAIRYVNATFGLSLKMKDNDIADAICQGTAFFLGAPLCDGK